ncbi:MAG: prolyl oligopeptidase family serine peptidase [Verrucomicrobiae bacterium]|nr:prolyl oligopeptidase family serine peptidase [Verrucomicrobiae bacterium]
MTRPSALPQRLALALALTAAVAQAAPVPDQVVADGIPALPGGLAERVAPYLEFRIASFQDWHPQRRNVLLTTRFADTAQLHLVQLPGGARRQLTFLPDPVASGTFLPGDGSRIVFQQDTGGGEFFQLFRLDRDTGDITLLTDGKSRNTFPRWAQDSRQLAYASTRRTGRDTDFYRLDPVQPDSDRLVAELPGGGWMPLDWSPDETRLLALSYVSINESSLHLIDMATGERRQVSPPAAVPVAYGGARFLPDGRQALVTTDHDAEFRRFARLDLGTGNLEPVGPQPTGDVESFDLSPDGRTVAWFTNEDGISVLRIADSRSWRERRVPALPRGVASGLRWHRNGREVAFSLGSARAPGEVYSVHARLNTLTRWTESETGGLNTARFADAELIRTTAFDGLPLSGFLYRPDPRRFPGPRPVLVLIHGGPESQSRPGFQGRWNYLVQELGIALLYPNVRGSSGFGKTFVSLDNGMKREDSVRDIGAFLDAVAADPHLDDSRVAVYGGSYGGYMVLASLIHHGERLRCGINIVGISNFLTFLRNTQDYRRDLRRAEYGDERDPAMAEFLARISPLSQVERIRRPLLIAQGLNDPRVPASESEQMVEALRRHGSDVWYLLARDEGHGFARKKNSDFMFLALVRFLEEHL